MRVTYRTQHVDNYWAERWAAIPADEEAVNLKAYPLRYALEAIEGISGRVLEAGCGSGRVLRYFHNRGRDIIGMDYVIPGLAKLADADGSLRLLQADMRRLPFARDTFQCVLAFGLYHSLEHGIEDALRETLRVLQPGGVLCASFRADNLQNRLIDWHTDRRDRRRPNTSKSFHKLNLSQAEFVGVLQRSGFRVEKVHLAQNFPFLYKFPVFRAREQSRFDESRGRRDGYRLNLAGRLLQDGLYALAPYQMCNVTVCLARKESA